jgi:ribosomal protein L13
MVERMIPKITRWSRAVDRVNLFADECYMITSASLLTACEMELRV